MINVKPKVTIGVCVRNSAATLRDAIKSIIAQDYPHELIEVIFVNDGSEDETLNVINSYIPKMDIKVKVFSHEWKGLGFSRNVVVNNAEGKYIIWVDGDMILPSDHIRKQIDFMENNSMVGIAKARHCMINTKNIIAVLEDIPFIINDFKNVPLDLKLPGTGGAIFKVDAIRRVNGFDENLSGAGEDIDIAYRIRDAGWRISRTSAHFYEKRANSWYKLWRKNFWYGYGLYKLYKKNRNVFSFFRLNPVAGLITGILYTTDAYRLLYKKAVFILPLHYTFKLTAWCFGFIKAQLRYARL